MLISQPNLLFALKIGVDKERRNQIRGVFWIIQKEHLSVLARQLTSSALRGDGTNSIFNYNVCRQCPWLVALRFV